VAFVLSSLVSTLLEIDEVSHKALPDGRLETTFVTTAVVEDLARLKTTLWALLAPPVQRVEDVKVEVLQAGPVTKRLRITVVTRPLIGAGRK